VVLAAAALSLLGVAGFWWAHRGAPSPGAAPPGAPARLPPPKDPRLTAATPFRNVRPEARYVGDEACADCHRSLAASYRNHPMGRSLAPVPAAAAVESYGADARNPFEAGGLLYRVDRRGDRVFHKETAAGGAVEAEAEVAFVVGSGRRGRSYLIDHDGYLFQSPLTWYPLKKAWDLSPSYDKGNPHFGRPITAGCLFCHCNQAEPDAHAANRFPAPLFRGHAVGCERCHGPGAEHVRAHEAGEAPAGPAGAADPTIVNPRHLEPALREAVCQQCHLQGEARVLPRGRAYFEYRPGLPLHLFVADFVRPAGQRRDNKFVGTVEQMYASRCFQGSAGPGRLGCISCHDPHALPAAGQRVAFYRDRCLKCHADRGCGLPRPARLEKSPEDSCVACHMPSRAASIRHTAVTDHTVPRHGAAAAPPPAADWPRPGQVPLVPFPRELAAARGPDQDRNLGLALVEVGRQQGAGGAGRQFLDTALPLLDAAVAGDPRDVAAWEAQASALMLLGRPEAARAACAAALREAPERETTLFLAAALALQVRRPAEARAFAQRAARVGPWMWQYRHLLAEALAQGGDWEGASAACREAIRLEPANLPCRQLLLRCYLRLGDKARARGEVGACLALLPADQQDDFRRWFEQQLRALQ
jgi:Flp pilus assembly protein TadD